MYLGPLHNLHLLHFENLFNIVKENNLSFEKHFLEGNKYYSISNHSDNEMMVFIVYLQYPEVTLGQYAYRVTYNQIQFWMNNYKMMDFIQ